MLLNVDIPLFHSRSREYGGVVSLLVRLCIHVRARRGARTRFSMVAGNVTRPGRGEQRAQGGALGDNIMGT